MIQDVLKQGLREAFLKDRIRDCSLWTLIVAGDPSSNSGPFQIETITSTIAEELAEVLKGHLDPENEHTAVGMVLPSEVDPEDIPTWDGQPMKTWERKE